MNNSNDDRSPIAKAWAKAQTITTISITMVVPCLIGYFVDQRLGTVVLFTFLGLAFGMSCAIWQLMKLVSETTDEDRGHKKEDESKDES